MNLIYESWIPIIRKDKKEKVAPWQISDSDIKDITSSRPDFKGGLYQFVIGLLQTESPPEDLSDWVEGWKKPPTPEELKERFGRIADAFEFGDAVPAFMQDYDLPDGESKPIAALLIESPGGKTLKDNLDHFIKRGRVEAICPHCAATALFTLQTNAPSGGVGHRVGLRGGGPLTTLILPDEGIDKTTLWQRLWLNILPADQFSCLTGDCKKDRPEDIFPWLAKTRTSERKTGKDTLPQDVHPLQMYWGMPRRIRLDFSETITGTCDLCGETGNKLLTRFRTKNYGVNYTGAWEHPLSPHNYDPTENKPKPPLPVHGQKGGISYRHWLGLVVNAKDKKTRPALVVNHYYEKAYEIDGSREARLWTFGYDLDNMKARCWYESVMPVYPCSEQRRETVAKHTNILIEFAEKIAVNTRSAVKKAWFKRPGDKKGDFSFIDKAFWQNTESAFYECLRSVIVDPENKENIDKLKEKWGNVLFRESMSLFDQWALAGAVESKAMKRTMEARHGLEKWAGIERNNLLGKKKKSAG